MLGRCLHALTYVLTFPAAALLVDFLFQEALEREPPSWGEGWLYMLPAAFLVGVLALIVEEGLYRVWGMWPKPLPTFVVRCCVFHMIYLGLAIDVAMTFQGFHSGLPLAGQVVAFLTAIVVFAMLAWPVGLVLGVVNASLLRTRARNPWGWAVVLSVLALIVFATPFNSWRTKARMLGWLERSLNEIPSPPGSARVYTEYRGCVQCATAEATAVYVADLSPREVCEFYRVRVPQKFWVQKEFACVTRDPGSYFLRAERFPSGDDRSTEGLDVIIAESPRIPSMGRMSESGRAESIRRAESTGKKTKYSFGVWYHEDGTPAEGWKCPCPPRTWRSTDR